MIADTTKTAGGTVVLHRVVRAGPERVYRAFLQAPALAKWLPPRGFYCEIQQFEPRVGGMFRMSFHNFATQEALSFGGTYLELVANERIGYTDRFDHPDLPGEMLVTVSLKAVSCGTDLSITQSGIPPGIPIEMCYLGWQESLTQLAHLVEPSAPTQDN